MQPVSDYAAGALRVFPDIRNGRLVKVQLARMDLATPGEKNHCEPHQRSVPHESHQVSRR